MSIEEDDLIRRGGLSEETCGGGSSYGLEETTSRRAGYIPKRSISRDIAHCMGLATLTISLATAIGLSYWNAVSKGKQGGINDENARVVQVLSEKADLATDERDRNIYMDAIDAIKLDKSGGQNAED